MKKLFFKMLFARILVEFTFEVAKWLIKKATAKKQELDEIEAYIEEREKAMREDYQ